MLISFVGVSLIMSFGSHKLFEPPLSTRLEKSIQKLDRSPRPSSSSFHAPSSVTSFEGADQRDTGEGLFKQGYLSVRPGVLVSTKLDSNHLNFF